MSENEFKKYAVISNKGFNICDIDDHLQCDSTHIDEINSNIIPDREVHCCNQFETNDRISFYDLSEEEACSLKNDPRILDVHLEIPNDAIFKDAQQQNNFQRDNFPTSNSNDSVNWGLKRHTQENYDSLAENTFNTEYNYSLNGTGVDLIIQDDGLQWDHPEFLDENGQSRVQLIDWYSETGVSGSMPAGFYDFTGDNDSEDSFSSEHGTHCAGIAAGKTYGWAKNCKIYSMRIFGGEGFQVSIEDSFELIRQFHLQKPVDPVTGLKRPTVVNQSWGYSWYYYGTRTGTANISDIAYKGVPAGLTGNDNSIDVSKGMIGSSSSRFGFQYPLIDVLQESLTDAGIICCKSAGNGFNAQAASDEDDIWDSYYISSLSFVGILPAGTPIYYQRAGSPFSLDTIRVGNISSFDFSSQDKAAPSSNRGSCVDVWAAGSQITSTASNISGYSTKGDYPPDPNFSIARISGTSMACPQITGMCCLLAQIYPNLTAAEAKLFLIENAKDTLYDTSDNEDYSFQNSNNSVYGAPIKIAYWPFGTQSENQFNITGNCILTNLKTG